MKNRIKAAACLLALAFAAAVIGASVYRAVYTDHDCGDGCSICEQLEICDRLVSGSAAIVCAASAAVLLVCAGREKVSVRSEKRCTDTLFSLKVMLLN